MDSDILLRLEPWLRERVGATGPLEASLIAGGRSNQTYRVTDAAGSSWALRRPPDGPRVASAHDVLREARIISALAHERDVPVPQVYGTDGGNVLGEPFFVMEFVEGTVLRGRRQSSQLSEPQRASSARSLIEVLAAIHETDLAGTGLDDLAPSTGYLTRQLDRWYGSYNRVRNRMVPDVDSVHQWLLENLPPISAVCLVHGDFRIDNAVVNDDGIVIAVLDWELATLGDPLTDLALTLAYWSGEGDEAVGPTALPGFPDREGVIRHYSEVSGRDLSGLRWHQVFAYWKLACAAEQIAARYAGGGGGGDRSGLDDIRSHTPRFAQRALHLALER